MVALFGLVGLIPLTVITFFPARFDWFGGPRPWYAPLIVLVFVIAVLAFVVRVIGSRHPVSVDGGHIFVYRWLGEATYPLEAVRAVRIDRETSIGGQSPVVIELDDEGAHETVSFLLSEDLDQDDLGRLLGIPVSDPHASLRAPR